MDNPSCIFWFSGTGNSLYAAKKLSAPLGMRLVRITGGQPPEKVGGKGAKIGFVFPSYFNNLPRAVRSFVDKIEILPETYVFGVVTMGALGVGSIGELSKTLNAKGVKLNYGRSVLAPPNYVVKYNPSDPEGSGAKLDKMDARLAGFAADIAARKQSVRFIPGALNTLYKEIEGLDAGFAAKDSCTGCGQCARICPVGNIRLESGKPVWLHHCEHCVACISWCPARAIDYGAGTAGRRRYRNPRISAEDMAT